VAWEDPSQRPPSDIYAQRISAAGAAQWTANGVAVCSALDGQVRPALVSDGAGGAISRPWLDTRGNQSFDIYAQRMNASGIPALAIQWRTAVHGR